MIAYVNLYVRINGGQARRCKGRQGYVVPYTATFKLSYSVSHIRTNTATGFEYLHVYSKKNIATNKATA